MNEGINEYLEGNFEQAMHNFDEVMKADSSFWPVHYYRGLCHKNSRKLKLAAQDFNKAISLNSNAPEPYLELGEIYHFRNKFLVFH